MYYLKSLSWRMTVLSSLQPFKNEILKVIAAIPLLRVLRFFTDLISLIFHSNTLGNPVVQTATQSLPTNAREVSLLLVSSSTWCMLQLWKHFPLGIFSGSCYKLCLSAAAKRFPLCPLCIYLYGPPKFVLSLSLAALRELQYQIGEWGPLGVPFPKLADKILIALHVGLQTNLWILMAWMWAFGCEMSTGDILFCVKHPTVCPLSSTSLIRKMTRCLSLTSRLWSLITRGHAQLQWFTCCLEVGINWWIN